MNTSFFRTVVPVVALFAMAGCSEPVPPPQPEGLPKEISLKNTADVVPETAIEAKDLAKSVQADFNLDGMKDVALVRKVEPDVNEVTIYIKKPEESSGSGTTEGSAYYRTATLRDSLNGKIVGVASRQRDKFTDLIILMSHSNAPTEMVQYENDGSRFQLVTPESSPVLQSTP